METASQLPFGKALRDRLGPPAHPSLLESSPRSQVWRIELSGRPAVLKQLVAGPGADERYEREVAALRIAGRASGSPVVPAILGTDPAERVLVLEHLDHRRPAPDWIVAHATALARLHSTAGPGDAGTLPRWQGPTGADVASFLTLAETLGVPGAPGVRDELHALVERLGRAEGTALLHGDPCPGNDLHTPDGVRFIDFEQASLGSGLMELAYLRIGFPTCWCVTRAAAPLLERAEAAYRTTWHTETGTALPDAGLADACAGWLIRGDALVQRAHRDGTDHLARVPDEDWEWGTATARQRLVHRLGVVADMLTADGDMRRLRVLAADLRRAVLDRWPTLRPVPRRRP
ncbi:aminoglycoside phosphotransferase family protein [Streptomyces pratensis]|uniref:aminoglycoside phosphotransferase family protein n=1 Tax=Streptomyces pratensis TaxID=1169025 RepID=UPI0019322407|nr:aminoglycoside phosphotransferase family protein [Streptomyces pratensis]